MNRKPKQAKRTELTGWTVVLPDGSLSYVQFSTKPENFSAHDESVVPCVLILAPLKGKRKA